MKLSRRASLILKNSQLQRRVANYPPRRDIGYRGRSSVVLIGSDFLPIQVVAS